jgi:hypothetical protein
MTNAQRLDPLFSRGILDRGFIEYVIETYLFGGGLGYIDRTAKESAYRRRKRFLQRNYPDRWEALWEEYKADMKDVLASYKHIENLRINEEHELSVIEKAVKPKQSGRPLKINLLQTLAIVKGYFKWKLGSPNWRLIAEILNKYYDDSITYESSRLFYQKGKRYLAKHGFILNEVEYAKMVYDQYLHLKDGSP